MRLIKSLLGVLQTGWSIVGIALLLLLLLNAWAGIGLQHVRWQWQPYVYWRAVAGQSDQASVNELGLRTTWTPAAKAGSARPLRVFMFGGSTMWGVHVGDRDTIPSQMAKIFAERGRTVEITNFGQEGYVSTQELLTLLLELRQGNVPDIAVFYDGVNDIGASTQRTIAGQTVNEENRELEFQSIADSSLLRSCESFGRSLALTRRLREWQRSDAQAIAKAWEGRSMEEVGGKVLRDYEFNLRMIDLVAKEFGFEAIFAWQPTVFEKDARDPSEQTIIDQSATTARYYRLIAQAIVTMRATPDARFPIISKDPRFFYLADVFDSADWGQRLAFTDFCHATAEANAHIATRLVDQVELQLANAGRQ